MTINNTIKNFIKILEKETTPRILKQSELETILQKSDFFQQIVNSNQKKKTCHLLIDEYSKNNLITEIHPGLYINDCKTPYPQHEEAALAIDQNAIISMHSILGEYGIINNTSDIITSVVNKPIQKDFFYIKNNNRKFRFYPINFNDKNLKLSKNDLLIEHPYIKKYVPEKAFCDMLFLAQSFENDKITPPLDSDYDSLDTDKVLFIAQKMNIDTSLKQWLNNKKQSDNDNSVKFHSNTRLGF